MSYTAVPFRQSNKQQQLLQFYHQELTNVYKEQCVGMKRVCETLLQDDAIKHGSTPIYRRFRMTAQLFLEKYPSLSRNGRYEELRNILNGVTLDITFPDRNKDAERIMTSVSNSGYWDVFSSYTKNYEAMVKNKFVPKFEEYQRHLTTQELKQHYGLLEWFKNIKNCSNYNCYYRYFPQFPQKINSPKD